MSSTGRPSSPPRPLMSSRHMSWASRADRLFSATGPVSERQYPIRIGVATWARQAPIRRARREAEFPGQGDTAGAAMFENDAWEAGGGFLARPITLPFGEHGKPGDRHRTGGDHAAHGHVMGFGETPPEASVTMKTS